MVIHCSCRQFHFRYLALRQRLSKGMRTIIHAAGRNVFIASRIAFPSTFFESISTQMKQGILIEQTFNQALSQMNQFNPVSQHLYNLGDTEGGGKRTYSAHPNLDVAVAFFHLILSTTPESDHRRRAIKPNIPLYFERCPMKRMAASHVVSSVSSLRVANAKAH